MTWGGIREAQVGYLYLPKYKKKHFDSYISATMREKNIPITMMFFLGTVDGKRLNCVGQIHNIYLLLGNIC